MRNTFDEESFLQSVDLIEDKIGKYIVFTYKLKFTNETNDFTKRIF